MKELEVKSTRDQIEEIKISMFWKDVNDELSRLRESLNVEYEFIGEPKIKSDEDGRKSEIYPTTAEVLIHLGELKGRKKAIEYFLALPEIFLNILEDKKETDKDGRE